MKSQKGRHGVDMSFLTAYLPTTHKAALQRLSHAEGVTMSAIVRALIKQRVEHLQGIGEVNMGYELEYEDWLERGRDKKEADGKVLIDADVELDEAGNA